MLICNCVFSFKLCTLESGCPRPSALIFSAAYKMYIYKVIELQHPIYWLVYWTSSLRDQWPLLLLTELPPGLLNSLILSVNFLVHERCYGNVL